MQLQGRYVSVDEPAIRNCKMSFICLQGRQGLSDCGENTAGSDQHHGPATGPPEQRGRHRRPPGRQVQRHLPHRAPPEGRGGLHGEEQTGENPGGVSPSRL